MLFCAFGGVGLWPAEVPRPNFAVTVIEINSAKEIDNAPLLYFTVFSRWEESTSMERV